MSYSFPPSVLIALDVFVIVVLWRGSSPDSPGTSPSGLGNLTSVTSLISPAGLR